MTKLDEDVCAVATVPGMVWEIKYKDESMQNRYYANLYRKEGLFGRILRLVRVTSPLISIHSNQIFKKV